MTRRGCHAFSVARDSALDLKCRHRLAKVAGETDSAGMQPAGWSAGGQACARSSVPPRAASHLRHKESLKASPVTGRRGKQSNQ